jgi:hypothetical protein
MAEHRQELDCPRCGGSGGGTEPWLTCYECAGAGTAQIRICKDCGEESCFGNCAFDLGGEGG